MDFLSFLVFVLLYYVQAFAEASHERFLILERPTNFGITSAKPTAALPVVISHGVEIWSH